MSVEINKYMNCYFSALIRFKKFENSNVLEVWVPLYFHVVSKNEVIDLSVFLVVGIKACMDESVIVCSMIQLFDILSVINS